MAPRDDRGRKKSGISITNIREGIWIIVIIILWYSAHSAHWQLAQQTQKYDYEIQELQRLVSATQDHSKSLLSTHCNVTAIAKLLASVSNKHQIQQSYHLRSSTSSHTQDISPHNGLVDKLYSLEESAADQFHHLEDRMFSMGGKLQPSIPHSDTSQPSNQISQQKTSPQEMIHKEITKTISAPSMQVTVTSDTSSSQQASIEWSKHSRKLDDSESREWLLFGIPTVPRVNNEDHLKRVLTSIFDQVRYNPYPHAHGFNNPSIKPWLCSFL